MPQARHSPEQLPARFPAVDATGITVNGGVTRSLCQRSQNRFGASGNTKLKRDEES